MKRDAKSPPATRHVARRTKRGRKAYVMKSVKSGLEIRLESKDELALARLLDLDPRGQQLRAQGETYDLVRGEIHRTMPVSKAVNAQYYTVDLTDVVAGITHVYEIKPKRFCAKNHGLFDLVEAFCQRNGMRFHVLSKEDFSKTLLTNIELLHQFARQCQEMLDGWAQAVDNVENKQGHVKEVLKGLEPNSYFLMAALLKGVIKADIHSSSLLSMDFIVEPGHGDTSMLEVLRYE